MKLSLAEIRKHNAEVKRLKDENAKEIAARELADKTVDACCIELTEMMGKEVTRENVRKVADEFEKNALAVIKRKDSILSGGAADDDSDEEDYTEDGSVSGMADDFAAMPDPDADEDSDDGDNDGEDEDETPAPQPAKPAVTSKVNKPTVNKPAAAPLKAEDKPAKPAAPPSAPKVPPAVGGAKPTVPTVPKSAPAVGGTKPAAPATPLSGLPQRPKGGVMGMGVKPFAVAAMLDGDDDDEDE